MSYGLGKTTTITTKMCSVLPSPRLLNQLIVVMALVSLCTTSRTGVLSEVTATTHSTLPTSNQLGNLDKIKADPKFSLPIINVTVPVGREAVLTCVVEDLGQYKVAWLRVDTQTILTIQNHVITKNHRVGILYSEHKTWQLKLKEIRESDRGWYMCQINTDPMKMQVGFLDVVVPPDILDYPTSTDMVVAEGSNVTLKCAATGSPKPNITWRREHNDLMPDENNNYVYSIDGENYTIFKVNRLHMGAYLCIATNGVPPTVSKRIMVIVHFPPMISIQNQLVGAYEGEKLLLECSSEAYPRSINYWTKENGEIVPSGEGFEPDQLINNTYRVAMKLSITKVSAQDFGSYKCIAKNSLGETDGTIKLYKIQKPNTIETPEKRPKGKNRKPGPNDILDDDPENMSKRKDMMVSGHVDESFELSLSISIHQRHIASYIILQLLPLLLLLLLLLLTDSQPFVLSSL